MEGGGGGGGGNTARSERLFRQAAWVLGWWGVVALAGPRGPWAWVFGWFFPWRLVVVVTAPRGASVSLGLASLPKEQGAGMDIHAWITW